jgi:hypothetical protein
MKKLFAFLALVLLPPAFAFGQSYPSPTYNNLTVQGTATLTNHPLAVSSGGTNAVNASGTALDNITGFSGTGLLNRTGAGAYSFVSLTNGIALTTLAQQAANTVLTNATGATADVTAFAMPSCSTSSSALNWTSGTGFSCNTSINAATLGSATFVSPGPIGSTTASTGAFTTLSASSTVSGTGFTSFVSTYLQSPSAIGSVTPAAGKFTTLQATSTISPSTTAGIVGTALADNANGGSVGEYASNSTSGTSLTTATAANCTSASLTAGDWNVWGVVTYVPAGTTTVSGIASGISTTSATLGGSGTFASLNATLTTGGQQAEATPMVRVNVSATTTVYLIGFAGFGTSTMTCTGNIYARRVR